MATNNYTKYDEDFKKSLVSLHQNGKTQTQLCKEYGVSQSALGKWVKQYSTVEIDDGEVLTAKQVKELQKRNAQLEKEETDRRTYAALNDLKLSVFSYIEGYYNSKRPHASLDYLTPNEMEASYLGRKCFFSPY